MEVFYCWGQRGGGGVGEIFKDEDQREFGSGVGVVGWVGFGSYSRRGEEGIGLEIFRRIEYWLVEMIEEGRGVIGVLEVFGVGDL